MLEREIEERCEKDLTMLRETILIRAVLKKYYQYNVYLMT